jgi:ubiquinone/menaquinone biosynthesis C-methylase UbiE
MDDFSWVDKLPREYETWPYQYKLRAKESELVFKNYPIPASVDLVLEIGAGNGFQATLLSKLAKKVIAIDLPIPDLKSHSIGFEKAKGLIQSSSLEDRIFLSGCTAERLPFPDETFDMVFSAYVFEHLTESGRQYAMREIRRVLKKNGIIITIVPAVMERVYYPLIYYPTFFIDLFKGVFQIIKRPKQRPGEKLRIDNDDNNREEKNNMPSSRYDHFSSKIKHFFITYHPTFPFPRPHGEFKSSWDEMLAYRSNRWISLHLRNGLRVERTFTTKLLPHNLIAAMNMKVGIMFYLKTADFFRRMALRSPFKFWGINFIVIARKE